MVRMGLPESDLLDEADKLEDDLDVEDADDPEKGKPLAKPRLIKNSSECGRGPYSILAPSMRGHRGKPLLTAFQHRIARQAAVTALTAGSTFSRGRIPSRSA